MLPDRQVSMQLRALPARKERKAYMPSITKSLAQSWPKAA
jgi:hypothetical protein